MALHVSVCSLIVFSTLGLLAGVESRMNLLWDKFVMEMLKKNGEPVNEIKVVPKRHTIYNDDDKLVELTLEDDENDCEKLTSYGMSVSVKFYLYTGKYPDIQREELLTNSEVSTLNNFDPEKPTCIVAHGWLSGIRNRFLTLIRDAYLQKGDVNLIIVDWSKFALKPYPRSRRCVPLVSRRIAKMIDFLKGHNKLDLAETTIVGLSLGAHVAGLAGYFTNGTVHSVVGLDPVFRLFERAGPGSRISTEDASYVQIIHTNMGILGYPGSIGHVDFYPNGGVLQPGCNKDSGVDCSHLRAPRLFAESINSKIGFHAKPCNSFLQFKRGMCRTNFTAVMGGSPLQVVPPGNYYLTTYDEPLYAKRIEC